MKTRIKEWFPALSVVILFTLLGFFIGWGIRSNFEYQDIPTGLYEQSFDTTWVKHEIYEPGSYIWCKHRVIDTIYIPITKCKLVKK